MKIEENIKMWSIIGQEQPLIAALDIAKNKNLITLTCDVSTSAGLDHCKLFQNNTLI